MAGKRARRHLVDWGVRRSPAHGHSDANATRNRATALRDGQLPDHVAANLRIETAHYRCHNLTAAVVHRGIFRTELHVNDRRGRIADRLPDLGIWSPGCGAGGYLHCVVEIRGIPVIPGICRLTTCEGGW